MYVNQCQCRDKSWLTKVWDQLLCHSLKAKDALTWQLHIHTYHITTCTYGLARHTCTIIHIIAYHSLSSLCLHAPRYQITLLYFRHVWWWVLDRSRLQVNCVYTHCFSRFCVLHACTFEINTYKQTIFIQDIHIQQDLTYNLHHIRDGFRSHEPNYMSRRGHPLSQHALVDQEKHHKNQNWNISLLNTSVGNILVHLLELSQQT